MKSILLIFTISFLITGCGNSQCRPQIEDIYHTKQEYSTYGSKIKALRPYDDHPNKTRIEYQNPEFILLEAKGTYKRCLSEDFKFGIMQFNIQRETNGLTDFENFELRIAIPDDKGKLEVIMSYPLSGDNTIVLERDPTKKYWRRSGYLRLRELIDYAKFYAILVEDNDVAPPTEYTFEIVP